MIYLALSLAAAGCLILTLRKRLPADASETEVDGDAAPRSCGPPRSD